MAIKYSEHWPDYITPAIAAGFACSLPLSIYSASGSLNLGVLLAWSISGVIFVSPFILLIGFPTLMWAKKFTVIRKWVIISMIGFVSSNIYLWVLLFLLYKVIPEMD